MPTPKKGPRLGGSPSHQRKILANLAVDLIMYRQIKTTFAKAKTLQPYFEKLVTKAKKGTIHDRRMVVKKIHSKDATYELFDVLVPEMDSERAGGYTRIIKLPNRKGDNTPMALIEVVTEPVMKKRTVKAAEAPAKAAAKASAAAQDADDAKVVGRKTAADEQAEATVAQDLEPEAGSDVVAEEAAQALLEEGDASAAELAEAEEA